MDQPSSGTAEALLASLDQAIAPTFTLWVPAHLTFDGKPIAQDFAMAAIVDQLLRRGYMPDGFSEGNGDRDYRYKLTV